MANQTQKIRQFLLLFLVYLLILSCGRDKVLMTPEEATPEEETPLPEVAIPQDDDDDGEIEGIGKISVSDLLDFGDVDVSGELDKDLIITNNGDGDLNIEDIVIKDSDNFVKNGDCEIIKPNEACNLSIKFKPGNAGEIITEAEIISDDLNTPTKLIDLVGSGKGGANEPNVNNTTQLAFPLSAGIQNPKTTSNSALNLNRCDTLKAPDLLRQPSTYTQKDSHNEGLKFSWDGGIADSYTLLIVKFDIDSEQWKRHELLTVNGKSKSAPIPLAKFEKNALYKFSVGSSRTGCDTKWYSEKTGGKIGYFRFKVE